ncbi:MAG TPA: hypothetical protein VLC97_20045, partial [Rhodanobacteraceae bacterium]|nr:hypothetical protein [Rhodanobacteraceae bacterium]
PKGLTAWSKVGILDASPFDADSAYAAIDRHRLDDFKPYVYRTHDGGKTWQMVAAGIPDGSFVNAVRADPVRRGLLYAGTEKGVYVSFDDGDHWQSLQKNLPVTSVRDLQVHDKDLVIATHGRGFWILDDLAALRQANADVAAAPAWLFAPSDAVRVRTAEFTGTPMPKDEPMAANPPDGAYIDYVLKATPKEPVTLEILDASGNVVRHYSSDVKPLAIDLAKWEIAPEWTKIPVVLSTAPGMHRFVWPLRQAAPEALAEHNPYADGVWAPPGHYTVALTVDGKRLTQPLTVLADPRVKLADEAYAQQVALARKIETLRVRVATSAHEAEKLLETLAQRRKGADAALARDIDALSAHVHALMGGKPSPNPHNSWALPPQRVQTLRYVGEALDALNHAVDGADAAPSPDAQAGFAKLQPLAETTVKSWQALQSHDVAAMNARLQKAGAAPLEIKAG